MRARDLWLAARIWTGVRLLNLRERSAAARLPEVPLDLETSAEALVHALGGPGKEEALRGFARALCLRLGPGRVALILASSVPGLIPAVRNERALKRRQSLRVVEKEDQGGSP